MANSVDLDQKHSDLGIHCFHTVSVRVLKVISGMFAACDKFVWVRLN